MIHLHPQLQSCIPRCLRVFPQTSMEAHALQIRVATGGGVQRGAPSSLEGMGVGEVRGLMYLWLSW